MDIDRDSIQLPPGKWASNDPDEYIVDYCPSCGKEDHFYWNVSKNVGICQRCSVVIAGLTQFKKVFSDLLDVNTLPTKKITIAEGPLSHPSYWRDNAWDNFESMILLVGRRVTEKLVRQLPIYYIPEERSITVTVDPISSEHSPIPIYRRLTGGLQKWIGLPGKGTGPYGFGIRFLNNRKTILLTEGPFDIMTGGFLGYGIAILGTKLNHSWYNWLRKNFKFVWIWLDPDEAGIAGREALSHALTYYKIPHKVIRYEKEAGDLSPKHPLTIQLRKEMDEMEGILNGK